MNRLLLTAVFLAASALHADEKKPAPTRADEAVAKRASADKAAAYLDYVAADWTATKKCVTCHTNAPFLMARRAVEKSSKPSLRRLFTALR